MSALGDYFSADTNVKASQRSTPSLFEHEVAAKPCRWPCDIPSHVHAEDLPSNRVARAGHPHWEQPYLNSDPSEVRD